ncbi:MAG TPA: hypothetical protein GXX42_06895 [Petrimonas sp.]|uniref:hypothetical protein n=1 Tax=Petrimonas sp. TaxID=2023866 RepID=UPI0009660DF1|nr:hypothetical protein [Petrimonas sp.]OJV34116.1 MAG: hypothetical protein BGO33_09450 [Bacteroidia bacterium 43-41]HHV85525.1 hypothetical protein [Petrimonas sp.]
MKRAYAFLKENLFALLFTVSGIIIAYIYWVNWGMYYGTLPLSSECWVNCTYGGLIGGLLGSNLARHNEQLQKQKNKHA